MDKTKQACLVADLHIHSIFSDGTLSPYEIVEAAKLKGLSAVAIADHDEIRGTKPALAAGEELGIKVIPAVELSAKCEGNSIHILGYFIDVQNPQLLEYLETMHEARFKRAIRIVEKLQEKGIDITLQDVRRHTGSGAIGRPHIAAALIEKGVVKNYNSAFAQYLGDGKSCYIQKADISPASVIQLITNANGLPVFAHPSISKVDSRIEEFISYGLKGIEVWCPGHNADAANRYLQIVQSHNLVATGGSDSHGVRKDYPAIGDFTVPYEVVENLEEFYRNSVIGRRVNVEKV